MKNGWEMLKSVPVTTFVEMNVCDTHEARGVDVEAVTTMSLPVVTGGPAPALDLCEECAKVASDALLRAFGMGGALDATETDSRPEEATSQPSGVPEQNEPETDTDADFKDYCNRITDTRKATKGRKLIYGTQSARAQFERHRSRIGVINGDERAHFEEWCRHKGVDVAATASHVEFRGFLWESFPDLARKYVDAMKGHSGDPDTSDRAENRLIREWARDHGYDVSKRGRLSMEVRHAYRLAHRESADKESHAA